MKGTPWQLELVKRSLKKKEKIALLNKLVRVPAEARCLDLGCAQGILSYFLKRGGGRWTHADQDLTNLRTTRELVGRNVVGVSPDRLPFPDGAFDLVAAPDYLEHVEDDAALAAEIARVLRPGGRLVAVVPHSGKFFLLHKLRPTLGMTLDFYGHKREGYSLRRLEGLLARAGLRPAGHRTYSKFFSESLELALNALYVRFLAKGPAQGLRDGRIRPTTAGEFAASRRSFRLYSLVYPLVWVFSRLDTLLFFQRGYSLAVWADRPRPAA